MVSRIDLSLTEGIPLNYLIIFYVATLDSIPMTAWYAVYFIIYFTVFHCSIELFDILLL